MEKLLVVRVQLAAVVLKRKHLLGDFSDEQNEQAENSKMGREQRNSY